MRTLNRLLVVTFCVAVTFATPDVFADDPQPTDPTLAPSGGSGGSSTAPTAADPDYWWNVLIPSLIEEFPNATYGELCDVALYRHNLLPPETEEPPPSESAAQPASE